MRYGCRAHDYGRHTPAELAGILHSAGYNAAQLALPKGITGIDSMDAIRLEQLDAVRTAFAEADIEISILSCYQDLSAADDEERLASVAAVHQALSYQKALGCGPVGSESAYRALSSDEKPAAFVRLTDSVLRIVEQAAKLDAVFALEPVFVHALGTADQLCRLLDSVGDQEHFKVIFDPVNVLTRENVERQDALWSEWIEAIGTQLAVVHMKDVSFPAAGPCIPTALGAGQMDYAPLRFWLHRAYSHITLVRDEVVLSAATADLAYMKAF